MKILYDSWGATMTLVDFYKVLRETPKGVIVQKIGTHNVDVEVVMPNTEVTIGRTYLLKKKVDSTGTFYTGSLDFSCKHYLYEFDGKPKKINSYD
jgi:hypothetical protein